MSANKDKRPIEHRHVRGDHYWRVQSDDRGDFDEIVVLKGPQTKTAPGLILHAEMLDNRSCYVDVAQFCLWVHVGRDGIARITMSEDRRPKASRPKVFVDLRDRALDRKRRRK
jgi:hypothetical protein